MRLSPCESCGSTWVILDETRDLDGALLHLVAAHSCDGIAVLATWSRPDAEALWRVFATDEENAAPVTVYDPEEGDVVPLAPPVEVEP